MGKINFFLTRCALLIFIAIEGGFSEEDYQFCYFDCDLLKCFFFHCHGQRKKSVEHIWKKNNDMK